MDKPICQVCQQSFEDDLGLHRHLKSHGLKMHEYYHKYFPRFDKYDGAPIKFKSKESYFYTDFNNKNNLKLWFNKVTGEEARLYIKSYFFYRKERKKLVYAPSQVELRSLPIVGNKSINDLFGDYRAFFKSLGFQIKFSADNFLTFNDISKSNIKDNKIIVDSREQNPLAFDLPTVTAALKFGDYCLDDNTRTCNCHIERKSLNDFYGTLGKGFVRFWKEFVRASNAGAYLIVIVESLFENVYKFSESSFFNKPLCGVTGEQRDEKPQVSSPEYILHNMRAILHEFPNAQFLFVENRAESSRIIEKIFASNCGYKDCDLQLMYDTKKL